MSSANQHNVSYLPVVDLDVGYYGQVVMRWCCKPDQIRINIFAGFHHCMTHQKLFEAIIECFLALHDLVGIFHVLENLRCKVWSSKRLERLQNSFQVPDANLPYSLV